MNIHVLLACFIGLLTVGYTLLASPLAAQPDSFETIAYVKQEEQTVNRFLMTPILPSGSFWQRGLTALA